MLRLKLHQSRIMDVTDDTKVLVWDLKIWDYKLQSRNLKERYSFFRAMLIGPPVSNRSQTSSPLRLEPTYLRPQSFNKRARRLAHFPFLPPVFLILSDSRNTPQARPVLCEYPERHQLFNKCSRLCMRVKQPFMLAAFAATIRAKKAGVVEFQGEGGRLQIVAVDEVLHLPHLRRAEKVC